MKTIPIQQPQVYVSTKRALDRRHFLKGVGVSLGLPLLDSMQCAFARGSEVIRVPRRFLGICNNLGLLPELFFPAADQVGKDYAMSPYLRELEAFKEDFTVFSGVWHPDVDGGHPADNCFLTAAPHPGSGSFRNTISLDQWLAERIGHETRFPSLTLGVNVKQGVRSLSWTEGGVMIPCEESAADLFRKLFLNGTESEVKTQMKRIERGQSIMDTVAEQARGLQRRVGRGDRERVDQYLTGVRDLEHRLVRMKEWEKLPKPQAPSESPIDPEDQKRYMEKVRIMYDMARMAFETDSTRLITLMLDSVSTPAVEIDGVEITDGYHSLSHHGRSDGKLRQLEAIDREHMRKLAALFGELATREESGARMFDHTQILYGSNLGNANSHVTTNLPVLFAGGGFRHGQHLVFDRNRNYPLPNLFVSILQRFGMEEERFASSTGSMRGLEMMG